MRKIAWRPESAFLLILAAFVLLLVAANGCGDCAVLKGDDVTGASLDDDTADDDAGDDDAGGPDGPPFPDNHKITWNCFICHEQGLYRAPQLPHGDLYDPPSDCMNCHTQGDFGFTDPDAPADHGSNQDCLTCHTPQHQRTFEDPDQCFVCHLSGSTTPTSPSNHDPGWDCYLCHDEDFLGAGEEPHGGDYGAPDDCVECHDNGSWTYTNPNAPKGHGSPENCLNCHQGTHGKTWTDWKQCLVCHQPGGGAPTSPQGHKQTWNCYLCHDADFLGALGEPHGASYGSPDDCTACHLDGPWSYTNPNAPDGHGSSIGCLNCHQSQHTKTWTDPDQCLVCHREGEPGPDFSNLHETDWNCTICHPSNQSFNGSPREPHGGQYGNDDCLACHAMGDFGNPRHGPEPEDDHTPAWNCLECHATRHGKPWQEKSQCMICHQF
ncbi:hypothetical protein K8I61_11115 [bacterium]|nr:hypothetical protein [bacterium]